MPTPLPVSRPDDERSAASDGQLRRPSVPDPYGLQGSEQDRATDVIAHLEREVLVSPAAASPVLDPDRFPSMPEWMGLRKSALALHPLYRANAIDRLADGLRVEDFEAPLVDGLRPAELLCAAVGEAATARTTASYDAFLRAPMSDEARLLMAGCHDARGIRSRAAIAAGLIREAARGWEAVEVASIACGAAGPVAETIAALSADGVAVGRLSLLDRDPMALAAARALVRHHVEERVTAVHLVDLVDVAGGRAVDLRPFAAGGWHVVDILGLFEYLPDRFAIDLVRRALDACRDGGVVVVANMLEVRPQQVFFERVIRWPKVIQRSPGAFLDLLVRAGAALADVELVVPADDAVYATAAIRVGRGR